MRYREYLETLTPKDHAKMIRELREARPRKKFQVLEKRLAEAFQRERNALREARSAMDGLWRTAAACELALRKYRREKK